MQVFRSIALLAVLLFCLLEPSLHAQAETKNVGKRIASKPDSIETMAVPDIPIELIGQTHNYMEFETARFIDWNSDDRSMLISKQGRNTRQLFSVGAPGEQPIQRSFEAEPIRRGQYSPDGKTLLLQKDTGGNEVYQIYALTQSEAEKTAKLKLLTDGKSRNIMGPWMADGSRFAFGSNKRTGIFNDIYIMDPKDPASAKMAIASSGGGWLPIAFSPNGKLLLVFNFQSVANNQLYLVHLESNKAYKITSHVSPVSYGKLDFSVTSRLWVTSDQGSDFHQLGLLDVRSGKFTPYLTEKDGISDFTLSQDDRFLAYEVSKAGRSIMRIVNLETGERKTVSKLSGGVIGNFKFSPWGELGLTYTSNRSATDVYSINPTTLRVKRWTNSNQQKAIYQNNIAPKLIKVKSFDGTAMSGYLYRPNPRIHKGKRPLIISIHGGPESQSTARFIGRDNYLVNELGIAIFYPNVRGSTGFGKAFLALDNGPFKREDSVKDIGAFLKKLEKDTRLDKGRFAVTGSSYGGYMTLASILHYPGKFRAAISSVGITNFVTFLENTEAYRRDHRRNEYGDERDPEQRAKLESISPLAQAEKINIPLMVIAGANDPRVPASESTQLVKAIQKSGGSPSYILAKNEGHGFRKKENIDFVFLASVRFWQEHLLDEKN